MAHTSNKGKARLTCTNPLCGQHFFANPPVSKTQVCPVCRHPNRPNDDKPETVMEATDETVLHESTPEISSLDELLRLLKQLDARNSYAIPVFAQRVIDNYPGDRPPSPVLLSLAINKLIQT